MTTSAPWWAIAIPTWRRPTTPRHKSTKHPHREPILPLPTRTVRRPHDALGQDFTAGPVVRCGRKREGRRASGSTGRHEMTESSVTTGTEVPRTRRRRRVLSGIALVLGVSIDRRDDDRHLDAPGRPQHQPLQHAHRERRDGSGRRRAGQRPDQHTGRRCARCAGSPRNAPSGRPQATCRRADGLRSPGDRRTTPRRVPGPQDPGCPGQLALLYPHPGRSSVT